MTTREQKLRQAAFTYLHVGILYEAAAWVAWQNGMISPARGPIWLWLAIGAAIVAVVFWLLWYRQSHWTARIIWALHTLRLPPLIQGAFIPGAERLSPTFYLVALVIVLINLVMLARAGWDL